MAGPNAADPAQAAAADPAAAGGARGGRFYIEESGTPIYARIARALGEELLRGGGEVLVVKPQGFSHQSFLPFVQGLPASSVYVSNAGRNIIQNPLPEQPTHYFEHFRGRLVFLHQDSVLSGFNLQQAVSLLQAWQRVAARSLHLCIEPSSVAVLHAAGIAQATLVPHASETVPQPPLQDGFAHAASFVGHVVPSQHRVPSGSAEVDAFVQAQWQRRQADVSLPLQEALDTFAAQALGALSATADTAVFRLAYAQWLRGQLMNQSMQFRGWAFEQADLPGLQIFGGDPGYINGLDRSLRIERAGLRYEPAVYDGAALAAIFQRSLVNLNITSLQFDHAVVNRFHDVFLAGGLCLTDRRSGLPALTSHHAELSYASLPELADKVRHFSHPKHRRERAQLIRVVQQDIVAHSGYPLLARLIRRHAHAAAG